MAKKPFINKHGFVEYPFLHDTRKQKNWWFYNLMEDHLKRRARQHVGPNYTRDDCEDDFKKILASICLLWNSNITTPVWGWYPVGYCYV